MNKTVYDLQIRSILDCLGHLRLIDLRELAERATEHGTDDEKVLLAAVMVALETLPPGHR